MRRRPSRRSSWSGSSACPPGRPCCPALRRRIATSWRSRPAWSKAAVFEHPGNGRAPSDGPGCPKEAHGAELGRCQGGTLTCCSTACDACDEMVFRRWSAGLGPRGSPCSPPPPGTSGVDAWQTAESVRRAGVIHPCCGRTNEAASKWNTTIAAQTLPSERVS